MTLMTRELPQTATLTAVDREEIQTLLQTSEEPCVSIYMPTFRAGAETQQNPIRLKNLLRRVQERLEETGVEETAAAELMAPVRDLVDDAAFWQGQADGLALFRSPGVFKVFSLPAAFDEHAVVENRFHLKPLFSMVQGDGKFYVLALSLKKIRLIAATRHSAEELDLDGVPLSLPEALGDLTWENEGLQPRPASRGVARGAVFHGHGNREEDLKPEIVQFFNLADKALLKHMDRNSPVVLAGVEYLLPRYHETTEHPNVLKEGLTGNADGLSAAELRDAAWEIVEPFFLEGRHKAAERFGDLKSSGRSSSGYQDILPAAHDGRIDTLFVARGVRLWGSYDVETRKAKLEQDQSAQRNHSEDLLDLAAVQTFLNGGTVYAVPQQEVPDGQTMAAIFRY